MNDTTHHSRRHRWALWLIGVGFLAAFIGALLLAQRVVQDLRQQYTARSDNVQWTLAQIEVDYLSFLSALTTRSSTDGSAAGETADVDTIRRNFDIFYSRIDTLLTARLFADLRQQTEFSDNLASVAAFLDRTVAVIDSPDAVLIAQIDETREQTRAIRPELRQLSLSGLAYFAQVSDSRRAQTATTLSQLAALSGGLLLALATLSIYLLRSNRSTRARGRELRQTYQRMNTILSTSLDAVIVVNSAGEVLEFNPAAEAIFGHSFDAVKGKSIGDLIVPDHLKDAHQAGMERMRAGGPRHVVGKGRVQLEAVRADGSVFPVELALQSAFDGQEEIVIGFVRDISQQVANETELISARDRALAGEKAKADFLTVMSHEIRTPLNGLLGNLTLLKNSSTTDEQKQFIRNMEISGQILLYHVDSVLDIARFEAGKLSVARKEIDLSAMLQDIVDGQSGNAASRGNAIEWRWVGTARPWVVSDPQRLRQILLNLVGNAINFTENGRISLEIEVVEQGSDGSADLYEFRVIDTGVGIADDDTTLVFEDFYTRDPSVGRTSGGTGLGLGIARRFTEAMGGEIGLESELYEGSVFWVRLPLLPAEAKGTSKIDEREHRSDRALDLLVVEDNQINLDVIRTMLEREGHTVWTATNGQEGVKAASAKRFDAIMMDINMPVMDGPTAMRHIRAGDGMSAEAPIVGVSANVLPEAIDDYRAAGMDAFIGKPISLDALRKVLSAVGNGTVEPEALDEDTPFETLKNELGAAAAERLLARFLTDGDELLKRIETTDWQTVGWASLADTSHKFAGSAAVFGAENLRTVLVDIEDAVKRETLEELPVLLKDLQEAWERTREALP